MIVSSKRAFSWGEGLKGHGQWSSNIHPSVFIPSCMSNGGGGLHVYIFDMIHETFKGINGFFFAYNCICESDFMCLSLLFSFAILALLKPNLLLLFTRLVRLGRTMFLLVWISRRLISVTVFFSLLPSPYGLIISPSTYGYHVTWLPMWFTLTRLIFDLSYLGCYSTSRQFSFRAVPRVPTYPFTDASALVLVA